MPGSDWRQIIDNDDQSQFVNKSASGGN